MNQIDTIHDGPVVDERNGYQVIDCARCGFRHVAPLPSADDIERWYREHHYSDGTRDRIDYHDSLLMGAVFWNVAEYFMEIEREPDQHNVRIHQLLGHFRV